MYCALTNMRYIGLSYLVHGVMLTSPLDSIFQASFAMDHPPKDMFSSFIPQQGQNSTFSLPNSPVSSRASLPQSRDPQLNMSLINNLVQIQGLDNNIAQQQLSTASPPSGQNASAQSSRAYNSQLLLEHQIKMSQLQQLQHLQKQIFQQQVSALSI